MIDLSVGTDVQEEKDNLGGGGFIWESGAYPVTIDMAYMSQSTGGAHAMNFVFKDEAGRNLRQTIYISSKEGNTFYVNKKTGKKHNLPGFTSVYNIIAIALNQDLKTAVDESEEKSLMLYDYDAGAEVATPVKHVLVKAIGQKVVIGVKKTIEDKRTQNDAGEYVASGETREVNEISCAFFPGTHLTVAETKSGLTEADFYQKWLDKWEGQVHDKSDKGAKPAAAKPEAAAGTNKLF